MPYNGYERAAANLVKQGPARVEHSIWALRSYLEESKRDFHRGYPELAKRPRNPELEREALRELLTELHEPLIRAIRKNWRHCGRPVRAESTYKSGEVGILVQCQQCTNKSSIFGREPNCKR